MKKHETTTVRVCFNLTIDRYQSLHQTAEKRSSKAILPTHSLIRKQIKA